MKEKLIGVGLSVFAALGGRGTDPSEYVRVNMSLVVGMSWADDAGWF